MSPRPNRFSRFTLRPILRIPQIDRLVILLLARRLLHRLQLLHRLDEPPPPLPDLPLRPLAPVALEVVKDPQPRDPRRDGDIRHRDLVASPERSFGVHLLGELFNVGQELRAALLHLFAGELQPAVVRGRDVGADESDPDAGAGSVVRIVRHEGQAVGAWVLGRGDLVEVFADHVGFDQGAGGFRGARGRGDREGGHETAGVQIHEGFGLLVRVHFDVLEGYVFDVEEYESALDESRWPVSDGKGLRRITRNGMTDGQNHAE